MNLSLLYRGPLTSCNYDCGYCPFAKRRESAARLARDRAALSRFIAWLAEQSRHRWHVLFTPWGEALVRRWYCEAIVTLTHLPHVDSVAAQTNLSCGLDWIEAARPDRLTLWATFHPTESERDAFVSKVRKLRELGVRLSVGMVAVADAGDAIAALRRELPADVYLWINAQQPRPRPYTPEETDFYTAIDPQFPLTARRRSSRGKHCRTGETTFTVDGDGAMRRCHFVDETIGNIYLPDWEAALRPRVCPNRYCHCFLGTSQLEADSLGSVFGGNLLERLPAAAEVTATPSTDSA